MPVLAKNAELRKKKVQTVLSGSDMGRVTGFSKKVFLTVAGQKSWESDQPNLARKS